MRSLLLIPLGIVVFSCALLTGCGFTAGNHPKSIAHAVSKTEERYGIELKVKRKALFPGGAGCDVYCTCKDLPGKEIRVYGMDERPSHMLVCSDYIYQKYGDDFLRLVSDTIHEIYPDHIVNMYERGYNHFPSRNYDKNTSFEDYISDNLMVIYDTAPCPMTKDEILSCYRRIKSALGEKGIKADLMVYSLKDKGYAGSVKRYDHIATIYDYSTMDGIACYVGESNGHPVYTVGEDQNAN